MADKLMTLIGMTASYMNTPKWTGVIHEVQGDHALVQYTDGTWQLVSLSKINDCTLTPPPEAAHANNPVGRGRSRFTDLRTGGGAGKMGDERGPPTGGPKR